MTSGTPPPHPPGRAPPTLRPGCARRAEAAGAEGAHWRQAGTLREPAAPAARLRVSGRPPSLAGRGTASLRGGEEGAVALASASRSSPAHAPTPRARARAEPQPPSAPPRPPAQPLAHRGQHPGPRNTRHQPETARRPSEKQQVPQQLGRRPGSSPAATRAVAGDVNPEAISSPR